MAWSKHPCDIGGFENVDFIVWMRTAALPNFRKLWRIVNNTAGIPMFSNGLPKGIYDISINNSEYIMCYFPMLVQLSKSPNLVEEKL